MNYNGEISKEIHVALTAISRAATAAYEAGDKGLWLDILGSNQALFKIYIAQLDGDLPRLPRLVRSVNQIRRRVRMVQQNGGVSR